MLRRITVLVFASALVWLSSTPAAAQGATYQLNYFENANSTADQQIRILNTGEQ